MCYFHTLVAAKAATDDTGEINAGHKAVIRAALSRYWAEHYIEGADTVSGYSYYPMAMTSQQEAFVRSGLKRPLSDIARDEEQDIKILKRKMAALDRVLDLTPEGLRLPLPTARDSFIAYAVTVLYPGNPHGDNRLAADLSSDDLKPLHRAVKVLHDDPETGAALERLVKGKIATLYLEAPQKVCPALVEGYEKLPEKVRRVSASLYGLGGSILLGGFSGLVGHGVHYGSVLGAGLMAGTAGAGNMILSGVFLAASYGGWHGLFGGKYKPAREQAASFAVQAGLTAAIAFGANALALHAHDHMSSEKAQWFQSLPEVLRDDLLRSAKASYASLPPALQKKLEAKSADTGIAPEMFLLTCSGDDPVTQEIMAHKQRVADRVSTPTP